MTLIVDSEELAAFCQRQEGVDFVAVDTEFMRDKTYWPKLCLVQVAGPNEAVCIDTMAPGIDLKPLWRLVTESPVLKVCLLYTSPSPRDRTRSRMPSSA